MIATHHMKVNGKWVNPGEEYGEPEVKVIATEPKQPEAPAVEVPEAEPVAEAKTVRRGRKKAE